MSHRSPPQCRAGAPGLVLDELSAGVPRLDVVPVADALALAELPAEQYLATTPYSGKVDESLVRILHVDAEVGDLEEERVDLLGDRIRRTPVVRRLAALKVFEERTHFWTKSLGLSPREGRHMLAFEYG